MSGPDYLVMEHCEGKTLAKRLASGPLPIEQVIEYGVQIADALDKAHCAGIIHRDLKPSNIMITKSGVKLLDFGLAKQHVASAPEESTARQVTEEGKILGTIQYMAPEVLGGHEADARSDIFALGLVLYEMATGKPAFSGTSKMSLIAAILEHEPKPVAELQPASPPALDRLIRACLAKDPALRVQSAHDVGLQLQWSVEPQPRRPKRRTALVVGTAAAAIVVLALGLLTGRALRTDHAAAVRPARFEIRLPSGTSFGWTLAGSLAISPDGQWIAFEGRSENLQQTGLYVRSLVDVDPRLIAVTEQGVMPFFSPDSKSLGYYADRELRRVALSGGEASLICGLSGSTTMRGATWGDDGTVLFADSGKIWRVSADGGRREVVAAPPAAPPGGWIDYAYPQFLPGSKYALITIRRGFSDRLKRIALLSVASGSIRELAPGSWARYAEDHIIYSYNGTLFSLPFNPKTLQVTGEPKAVLHDVFFVTDYGRVAYDLSRNGSLIYVPQLAHWHDAEVVWIDRQGHVTKAIADVRPYDDAKQSPDGKFIATVIAPTLDDIDLWKFDLEHHTWTRLTSGFFVDSVDWSPDARSLVISSGDPVFKLYRVSADGVTPPQQLTSGGEGGDLLPQFSPDGKTLLFTRQRGPGRTDLMALSLNGNRSPQMFLGTGVRQIGGRVSPNGRWVAYNSDETGERRVFVCPFPRCEPRAPVSEERQGNPFWSHDGRELFYSAAGRELWSVDFSANDPFKTGTPKKLFTLESQMCQASIDGTKFLAIVPAQKETEYRVIYAPNWIAELSQPAGK